MKEKVEKDAKEAKEKSNQESRYVGRKDSVDWEEYIKKAELILNHHVKIRNVDQIIYFFKSEYCRPATGDDSPNAVTMTVDEENGIIYKVDDDTDPKANIDGYEAVSFCKNQIHFFIFNTTIKR